MKWLFGYGSPVTMGVLRMVVGTLMFVNLTLLATDLEAWFTERGFYPAWFADRWVAIQGGVWRLNLLQGVTDDRVTFAFFSLVWLSALFTTLGLWSRVSSVVLFVGTVTLHHRSPDILHSGDTLLRVMTFYVMVSPSGLACSLDRLIGLWRGKAPAEPPRVSLWPQRLVQFQVAIIYFTTVYHKWFGTTWRYGTATYYPPHLEEFDRFPVPAFLGQPPMLQILTYGTLAVEIALATLVFAKPFRKWVLLAGVLLHAGIEYQFNIPLFAWIMVATYLAFYEGEEVTEWARRLGGRFRRFKARILAPEGTAWRPGPVAALEAIDALGLVEYSRGSGLSVSSEPPSNPAWLSWSRSLGAWPFFWALPLWGRLLACATDRPASDLADSDAIPAERRTAVR
jgi:hypothetical protein